MALRCSSRSSCSKFEDLPHVKICVAFPLLLVQMIFYASLGKCNMTVIYLIKFEQVLIIVVLLHLSLCPSNLKTPSPHSPDHLSHLKLLQHHHRHSWPADPQSSPTEELFYMSIHLPLPGDYYQTTGTFFADT